MSEAQNRLWRVRVKDGAFEKTDADAAELKQQMEEGWKINPRTFATAEEAQDFLIRSEQLGRWAELGS